MKTHITHIINLTTALGLLTCAPASLATENLFPNGDLEQSDVLPSGLPEGMSYWQSLDGEPVALYYLCQEEKSSGSQSLCIERLDYPGGHSRVFVARAIPVEPEKQYSFSCKIKSTEFAKDKPGIYIRAHEGNSDTWLPIEDVFTSSPGAVIRDNWLYFSRLNSEDPEGFNEVEMTFTTPVGGYFLTIFADLSWCTDSKAWFDDFELVQLD